MPVVWGCTVRLADFRIGDGWLRVGRKVVCPLMGVNPVRNVCKGRLLRGVDESSDSDGIDGTAYDEDDEENYTVTAPDANRTTRLAKSGLVLYANEDNLHVFNPSWDSNQVERWLRKLFPKVFKFLAERAADDVEDGSPLYRLAVRQSGGKHFSVLPLDGPTGADLDRHRTGRGKPAKESILAFGT